MDPVKNFAVAEVNGIDAAATTLTVPTDIDRFPDPAVDGEFNVVIWNSKDYQTSSDDPNREIVRVTAKSGNDFTITRGQEGTTAQTHNISGKTYKILLGVTEKTINDLINLTSGGIKEWDPTKTYNINDLVYKDGGIYSSVINNNTSDPTDRVESGGSTWSANSSLYTGEYTPSVQLKDDGSKLYTTNEDGYGKIIQYDLPTPFDLGTATNKTEIQLPNGGSSNGYYRGLQILKGGVHLYVYSGNNGYIKHYTMSTPWDISTAVFQDEEYFGTSYFGGLFVSEDGTKFFTLHSHYGDLYQKNLQTPFDLSSATYVRSKRIAKQSFTFTPCGKTIYGTSGDYMYTAKLTTPFDISTIGSWSYNNVSYNTQAISIADYSLFLAHGSDYKGIKQWTFPTNYRYTDCAKWQKITN